MCPVMMASPTLVLLAVGAPVLAGLASMVLPGRRTLARPLVAAAGPVLALVLLAVHLQRHGLSTDGTPTDSLAWVPSLHLDVSFLVDGLGTFFALLIAGVGVLVVLYSCLLYTSPSPRD